MKPEYNVVCIPLDGRSPAAAPAAFTVAIACELRFPQGSFPPAELARILAQHPLLGGPGRITARVKPFAAWQGDPSMTGNDSFELTLVHQEKLHGTLSTLSETLSKYMGAPNVVRSSGVEHDPSFDLLNEHHFVDVARAYDDFVDVKRLLQRIMATAPITAIKDLALQPLRRLDSAILAAILDAMSDRAKTDELDSLVAVAGSATKARSLRSSLDKIERRLTVKATTKSVPYVASGLASKTASGIKMVESSDPNVAIHAAFRNQLLAGACGFVTYWTTTTPKEMIGDFVIQPDLPGSSATVDVTTSPTAFRRSGHTHPLAYGDVGSKTTTTCGLAALNSPDGSPRYRASSVNTEAQLVKDLLVQAQNSLSSLSDEADLFGDFTGPLDTRRPKILRDEQIGSSEPETPGITFSAPVEDLVTHESLKAASVAERKGKAASCYFLEDLWIGFRLDLAQEKENRYRSVHAQRQRVTFRYQGSVEGECEDFYDREQADDPARGYTSTEFGTYNGMSNAQAHDFRLFLGLEKPGEKDPNNPFEVTIKGYGGVTRLLFGQTYQYRLRSVFLGCISLGVQDTPTAAGDAYVQSVPFYRARRFRPGELVASPAGGAGKGEAPTNKLTIFLSDDKPKQRVTIVPTPIDIDTSRYYGLILQDESEANALEGRRFVRDAGELFADGRGTMNYFFDPEVASIIIRARVLNGGPRHTGADYSNHDGAYCEVVQHVNLAPVRQRYGKKGEWQRFKPIIITFRTTTDSRQPAIEKSGFLFDCHQVEVRVPPAFEMELSIIPDVERADLERTSYFVSSSSQHRSMKMGGAADARWNPAPAIAEQILRVIHAVPQPLDVPRIVCAPPARPDVLQRALRQLDEEVAEVPGRIEVHAASTGQVHLQATWSDVDDNPAYESFAFNSGQASTATHSIVFGEMPTDSPVGGLSRFRSLARRSVKAPVAATSAQCAENKIFLGGAEGIGAGKATDSWHAINFKDARRKVARVVAVGRSRFEKVFGDAATDLRSPGILIDVPSTVRMLTPRVSHILPLGRKAIQSNSAGGSVATEYAFRIFLMRPWFQSGPGERLAVGCLMGNEPDQVLQALDKTITQWGEDPVERPGLVISRRAPRASDFRAPASDVKFDERLYPTNAERTALMHRDNIPPPTHGPKPERRLTVASYAVALDSATGLWFCDVAVAPEFFGWCGLALYRHQPNACEGRELSDSADWAYAAVIHGDPVAWIERGTDIHITVGPCFDPYATYEFDYTAFKDGVSEDVSARTAQPTLLRRYQVGRAYYFEAATPSRMRTLNLTKRRFEYGIASIPLAFE